MIRLSKSSITSEDISAVVEVLQDEYLGMGPQVRSFEEDLSSIFKRPVCVTSSGTSALQLALQASGVSSGDEVLVQSLTYVATIQAITATGAQPIFCDVNPGDISIDLNFARKVLSPRTKAIVPVHYAGGVGDLNSVYRFARLHNLRVIEDAAHAFGTSYQNKLVGSQGDITIFSFDGIKNITSGEGGCIISSDESIVDLAKEARLLGVQGDSTARAQKSRTWDFDVLTQGWRYHQSDLMAALGRSQLKRLDQISSRRRDLYRHYIRCLSSSKVVTLLDIDIDNVVPHIFPVILDSSIDRDMLRDYLLSNDVQTGLHYKPNHLLSYFAPSYTSLPVTEALYKSILTLPLHLDLSHRDVETVCFLLNSYNR